MIVTLEAALKCGVIAHLIEDCGTDDPIPLPNISTEMLKHVMKFCSGTTPPLEMEFPAAINLAKAAHYLDCKELLDVCGKHIASFFIGKTPEYIAKTFGINPADVNEEWMSWC